MLSVQICGRERLFFGWWESWNGDVSVVLERDGRLSREAWQNRCIMWSTRCYWFTGFAFFCSSKTWIKKNITSPKVLRRHLRRLLTSSETFLRVFRGARLNETTLCLFVVVSSRYNGLCVGDGCLQPRPCSHLNAVILKNWNTTL